MQPCSCVLNTLPCECGASQYLHFGSEWNTVLCFLDWCRPRRAVSFIVWNDNSDTLDVKPMLSHYPNSRPSRTTTWPPVACQVPHLNFAEIKVQSVLTSAGTSSLWHLLIDTVVNTCERDLCHWCYRRDTSAVTRLMSIQNNTKTSRRRPLNKWRLLLAFWCESWKINTGCLIFELMLRVKGTAKL